MLWFSFVHIMQKRCPQNVGTLVPQTGDRFLVTIPDLPYFTAFSAVPSIWGQIFGDKVCFCAHWINIILCFVVFCAYQIMVIFVPKNARLNGWTFLIFNSCKKCVVCGLKMYQKWSLILSARTDVWMICGFFIDFCSLSPNFWVHGYF